VKFVIERELHELADSRGTATMHQSYWNDMARRRILLHGGTWSDGRGETLLLEVDDPALLQDVLSADPYVQQRLVLRSRIRQLDSLVDGGAPPVAARLVPRAYDLNPHERRIAQMMLSGLTNRQIAERLGVSRRAVEQHITRIYRKLSISRRAQLPAVFPPQPSRAG